MASTDLWVPPAGAIHLDYWQDALDPDRLGMEWRWPHFTPFELRCRGTSGLVIIPDSLDRLERLRENFGRPMRVTSAWRHPEHNNRISSTGLTGPHTTARAYDIQIAGSAAELLDRLAAAHGYTGRGWRQHGPWEDRIIHLDDLPDGLGCPRPRIWSYP